MKIKNLRDFIDMCDSMQIEPVKFVWDKLEQTQLYLDKAIEMIAGEDLQSGFAEPEFYKEQIFQEIKERIIEDKEEKDD